MTLKNYPSSWVIDPFDIVWKNILDSNSTFNTLQEKVSYPVDIYETPEGLHFELAAVGLNKEDLQIQVEGDVLRIKCERQPSTSRPNEDYLHKGIAKRSFDLAWKLSSKLDLTKLEAKLEKGLLSIAVPYAEDQAPKLIEIKQ